MARRAHRRLQHAFSLQELRLLGGWRSFSMVLRYSHFAPHHLAGTAATKMLERRTKTGTQKNTDLTCLALAVPAET
jgi:hypothetical protein